MVDKKQPTNPEQEQAEAPPLDASRFRGPQWARAYRKARLEREREEQERALPHAVVFTPED